MAHIDLRRSSLSTPDMRSRCKASSESMSRTRSTHLCRRDEREEERRVMLRRTVTAASRKAKMASRRAMQKRGGAREGLLPLLVQAIQSLA